MTPHLLNKLRNEVWSIEPGYLETYLSSIGQTEAMANVSSLAELSSANPASPLMEIHGETAVITFSGVLGKRLDFFEKLFGGADYDDLSEALAEADSRDDIRNVVLHLDTPGGSVIGLSEAANNVAEMSKPVYAFTDTMAASAGYWLASQATAIYSTESARVGSIGAMILHQDVSGFLENLGIKTKAFFKGKHKVDHASFKPLTKAEEDDLQERVNIAHDLFSKAVKRARKAKVSSEVFDSKIYDGAKALEVGLTDGHIANLGQLLSLIQS
jgi:capsid assembly protease